MPSNSSSYTRWSNEKERLGFKLKYSKRMQKLNSNWERTGALPTELPGLLFWLPFRAYSVLKNSRSLKFLS